VDTDAREPALLRRIEELVAAAAADEPDRPEGPVLAAALTGLRAELGGLRADLGSLRAEIAGVRTGVDASVGRLAGELSAAKSETAALTGRHEELVDKVDDAVDILGEVKVVLPGLRSTLDAMPGGSQFDTLLTRVEDTVAARLDTVSADLRRTLAAGLTTASAGSRAAETASQEARSALEERLAAVEDTLDGLAERLEALTRDSIASATDRIAQVEQRIITLADSILAEQANAQNEWADSVRSALTDLAQAVDRNLSSLGVSLTDAVGHGHYADDERVAQVLGEIRAGVDDAVSGIEDRLAQHRDAGSADIGALRGFLETSYATSTGKLDEVRSVIAGGLAEARSGLVEELASTLSALETANDASRGLIEEEIGSLRTDLADALEEVRDRIAAGLDRSSESITSTVDEQRGAFDEVVRTLRSDVLDRVEAAHGEMLSALADMQAAVTAAGRANDDVTARLRDVEKTSSTTETTVSALHADWTEKSDSAVAVARQSSDAVLASVREHVEGSLAGIREALDRQTATVREHSEVLSGGTGRLVAAGHALLGYLAERDRIVEDERTQSFHELLDAFAEGLSAKERRKTSGRLADALERRRTARDADRYRKQLAGEQPADLPAPPADLAALAGPLAPPRAAKKAPAATTPSLATPVKAAKKAPAKVAKKAPPTKAAKKAAAKQLPAKESTAKEAPVETIAVQTVATEAAAVPAKTAKAAVPAKKAAARRAPAKKAPVQAPPEPGPADELETEPRPDAPISGDTGTPPVPPAEND
jgi:hypothetical protein